MSGSTQLILILSLLVVPMELDAQEAEEGYAPLQAIYTSTSRPLEYFQDLVKKQPDNPWAWHFLGRSADECGLEREAQAALQKAQGLSPAQAWHWQSLGDHWSGRRQYAQAASFYKRAGELETRAKVARSLRAKQAQAQRSAEARESWKNELETSQSRTLLLGILAVLVIACFHFFVPRFFK